MGVLAMENWTHTEMTGGEKAEKIALDTCKSLVR